MLDDLALDLLLRDLASPDPALRDDTALPALADALLGGSVTSGQQEWVGDVLAARLQHPDVWTRSFAVLVLGVLADAGVTRDAWVDAACRWYPAETDLRGHDPALGWLHAVAHGADALAAWGRARSTDPDRLLATLASRLLSPTDTVWRDQEDDRVAHAIATILTHPGLDETAATRWVEPLAVVLAGGEPGAVPAPVSNTLHTLRSLSIALEHEVLVPGEPTVVPHRDAVRRAVASALRPPTAWMWR